MTIITGTPVSDPEINKAVADLLGKSSFSGDIFIQAADSLIAGAISCNANLDVDPLRSTIRAYLTAHFFTVSNPQSTSRSINGASKSFSITSPGEGLKQTSYGRAALSLDSSGCLERQTMRPAGLTWVGTTGDGRRFEGVVRE